MRKVLSGFLVLLSYIAVAHEGMWLPTVLKSIEGDMQSAGLKLTAEDIYSVNHGSIKDAIVLFGGGCTAEVISGDGLILTNHHCGFSAIADHSTLENDYLKNGFWAADRNSELRNASLTATFVVRMEDVTDRILPQLAVGLSESDRRDAIGKLSAVLSDEAVTGTHYGAVVRSFNYGNSYYLIVGGHFAGQHRLSTTEDMPTKSEKENRRAALRQLREAERVDFYNSLPMDKGLFEKLFDYLDEKLEEGCDHSLTKTLDFLKGNGIRNTDSITEWLSDKGGFCDCEVIANVEEMFD